MEQKKHNELRFKAIVNSAKHGLLPYWMYEKEKHYDCSYWEHLWINIKYAWRWLTFQELESDIEFEIDVNSIASQEQNQQPKTEAQGF